MNYFVKSIAFPTILSAMLALQACLPTNIVNRKTSSSSAKYNFSGTGSVLGPTTESDGARGQCQNYDPSNPERAICIGCYDNLLDANCPGKTDPDQCLDPTIKATFTTLVNKCIVQTSTGNSCNRTCGAGQVLDTAICACVANTSTGISGSLTTDSGQFNFGPPVVSAYWPEHNWKVIDGGPSTCQATVSAAFTVQNRGDTISQFNQYGVLGVYPQNSDRIPLNSIIPPTVSSTGIVSDFNIITEGTNEFIHFNDFEPGSTTNPYSSSGTLAIDSTSTTSFSQFLGPQQASTAITLTLGNQPSGYYFIALDLYLIGGWQGSYASHGFKITTTSSGVNNVAFHHTFSTQSTFSQSYSESQPLRSQMTYNGSTAAVYHLNIPFTHSCASASGCTLSINFTGTNLNVNGSQRWGLDNLGVMAIPRMAIKYSFTDSNQMSSYYCMNFNVYTSCGRGSNASPVTCNCWAERDPGIAPFVAVSANDDCANSDPRRQLVNGNHTIHQCQASSGEVVDSTGATVNLHTLQGTETLFCKFSRNSCPSGWTQYQNWSESTDRNYDDSGCNPAVCPGHAWSNTQNPSCQNYHRLLFSCVANTTVTPTTTAVGCY